MGGVRGEALIYRRLWRVPSFRRLTPLFLTFIMGQGRLISVA